MRQLAAALMLFLLSVPLFAQIDGAWTAIVDADQKLYLQMTRRPMSTFGQTIRVDQLEGLTLGTITSSEPASTHFRLVREAGTIVFDGTFRDGNGGGQFRFTPNTSYAATIRAIGLDLEPRGDQTEHDLLLSATVSDLSTAYIRALKNAFPEVTFRDARRARGVNVTPDYVAALRGEGVAIETLREATRLAGAGVTPQFVRDLAAAGYRNVSVRDLTRLAAHGVSREYIEQMSKYKSKRP